MFCVVVMITQNSQIQNKISFKGYDARPLKGFVMNSNYAGIAEEMKRIGEQEDFDVFLFEGSVEHPKIVSNNFKRPQTHAGCWAQDMWGVVKNTLLSCENFKKQFLLQKTFNLKENEFQKTMRNKMHLDELRDSVYEVSHTQFNDKLKFLNKDESSLHKKKYEEDLKFQKEYFFNLCKKSHIKGGNYYITKDKQGQEEILIGVNELKKFTKEELESIFQTDKIHILPQADFHLDLFVRPLTDKKVLIADDELMLKVLSDGYKKICDFLPNAPQSECDKIIDIICKMDCLINRFKFIVEKNPYAKMKDVENKLLDAGYEPIKVPARVFEIETLYSELKNSTYLSHLHNYMNANVQVNKKGEIVYITNKSTLDELLGLTDDIQKLTGFSLQKEFLKAVKKHVDKVYFVSGENNELPNVLLKENLGGIHCAAMEIPV